MSEAAKTTFTTNQFQLERAGFKIKLQKKFKGTQTAWHKFLKPAINSTPPSIGMALAAKNRNPGVGKATTNILKSKIGGKISSLTDMQGKGLILKDM